MHEASPADTPGPAAGRLQPDAPGGPSLILYFLRHADAEDASPGGDDLARPLTAAGIESLTAAGHLWRRLNLRPDRVLTSPALRARQTAELAVRGLGLTAPPTIVPELAPGADWPAFARAGIRWPDARRVLFVGHEPDLSSVIAELTGAASVRMRKGGLACVEFPGTPEPGAGELAWLLDPDLYDGGS